jgi:competence protein ComEC
LGTKPLGTTVDDFGAALGAFDQDELAFCGLAVVACAATLWLQTEAGSALSKPRGTGFVMVILLENDDAPVSQEQAAGRMGLTIDGRHVEVDLGGWGILQVNGKAAPADLVSCDGADTLILNQIDVGDRPCSVFDIPRLRETGSLALNVAQNGDLPIETAHHVAGARAWNIQQCPRENRLNLNAQTRKKAAEASQISEMTRP